MIWGDPKITLKSSNFKLVSKAFRIDNMNPESMQKHLKWHRHKQKPNTCESLSLPTLLKPNPWFWSPRHPDTNPEIIKNVTYARICQKMECEPKVEMWSRNLSELDRNASLDPNVSLHVLQKCPWIIRWSSRCENGANRHATWHILGTKTDTIRSTNFLWIVKHMTSQLYAATSDLGRIRNCCKEIYQNQNSQKQQAKEKGPVAWAKP